MGRKGKWITAVKRVFSPESKEKKGKVKKSRKGCGFGSCTNPSYADPSDEDQAPPSPPPPKPPVHDEIKLADAENEQSKHAYSVALASAVAAEAAVVAAKAAAEVVRLTSSSSFAAGRSREEIAAAIKIQTAFRGYLARRELRALRGLVRLKSLVHGNAVKQQTANTLRCMQTLARVQSQIRSRRMRMTEENQALQRQLQLKRERELEKLRLGEEWDDSLQSKEKIEANLLNKHEAAIRRERALAYAFSHQWKSSSRSISPTFMDPNNPQWGWNWLERWMSARPWEGQSVTDNDHASIRSTSRSVGGEIPKAYSRRDINSDRMSPMVKKSGRPPSRQSPSTPTSKASSMAGRAKPPSPRGGWGTPEDDSRSVSMLSMHTGRHDRRQSIGGSSIRDDESLASSPAIPSYMAPTQSTKARSRFQTPLCDKFDTSERGSVSSSAKKRLSFPMTDKNTSPSPTMPRRHSGPPKVDIASLKEASVPTEHNSGGEQVAA